MMDHALAIRLASSLMLAIMIQESALSMFASKSFARRRFRLIQAMFRSTPHRRGKGSKPLAWSERLLISGVHVPIWASAVSSFGPA